MGKEEAVRAPELQCWLVGDSSKLLKIIRKGARVVGRLRGTHLNVPDFVRFEERGSFGTNGRRRRHNGETLATRATDAVFVDVGRAAKNGCGNDRMIPN